MASGGSRIRKISLSKSSKDVAVEHTMEDIHSVSGQTEKLPDLSGTGSVTEDTEDDIEIIHRLNTDDETTKKLVELLDEEEQEKLLAPDTDPVAEVIEAFENISEAEIMEVPVAEFIQAVQGQDDSSADETREPQAEIADDKTETADMDAADMDAKDMETADMEAAGPLRIAGVSGLWMKVGIAIGAVFIVMIIVMIIMTIFE